jgi:phosphoribosylanthranilate isomerase
MARIRVKICGITRFADALAAVELGADALGFVFYPDSPRWLTPTAARDIIARLPPLITTVGLFVNTGLDSVRHTVAVSGVDLVQFHGQETPDYCAQYARPYIKAVHAKPGLDIAAAERGYRGARALLVDTYHPQLAGGTGETFDWSLLTVPRTAPLILAGGLTVENVGTAIAAVRPYAVDVSGGVESSKGIKDVARMREFIAEVTKVERYP